MYRSILSLESADRVSVDLNALDQYWSFTSLYASRTPSEQLIALILAKLERDLSGW